MRDVFDVPCLRFIFRNLGDTMSDFTIDREKEKYHWLVQFTRLCDRFPDCSWEPDDKPARKELCIDMSVAETRLRKVRDITDGLLCKLSETFER